MESILNQLKRFNKPKEEKEVTKQIGNKSQSSKSYSTMNNFFRKLSIRSKKRISLETALGEGEKEPTSTKNFVIKTRCANETKNVHLNDNTTADFVTEKISNLKLNDVSTDYKKSTLQKCNNEITLDKKNFDNSKKTLYFDKNIKVEDRYDIAPNAVKSKSKYSYNEKVKSLNPSWIDGKNTKIGSIDKFSNNLGTISYNNKVKVEVSSKLLNTDSDVHYLGSKDIKIEEENELDCKSESTPVTLGESKYNISDFHELSSKPSKYVDYTQDYKSVSNSDNADTPIEDLDIIERDPTRNHHNKNTHRVNPSQRKVDQGKKVHCHSSVGSTVTVNRSIVNSTLDCNFPANTINAALLRREDCYGNFDSFNPYIGSHATQISCSLFSQEQLYWNMRNFRIEDIAKREADKIIDSYVEGYRRQELEHISSCLQCNIKIIAQTEADKIIDRLVESYRQQESQSMSQTEADKIIDRLVESYRRQESQSMSLGSCNPENFSVFEEIEKYIDREMNQYILEIQKGHCNTFDDFFEPCTEKYSNFSDSSNNYDFSKANEVLASRDAAIPEFECNSPDSEFNDLSNEGEHFCDEIKNYVNNFFQCDNLVPNSCAPELEKFCNTLKKGYFNTIASKDQQNCNSELKLKARNKLITSAAFSKDKCREKYLEMYKQIRSGEFGTEAKGVIHNLKPKGEKKYRRTNLHAAVMEGDLEKAFCIVEIHKQHHGHITFGINIRDNKKKTVLDRANENKSSSANDLLIDYLKENNAMPSIHHMLPISTPGT